MQDAVGDKALEKMILWSKMLQALFIQVVGSLCGSVAGIKYLCKIFGRGFAVSEEDIDLRIPVTSSLDSLLKVSCDS